MLLHAPRLTGWGLPLCLARSNEEWWCRHCHNKAHDTDEQVGLLCILRCGQSVRLTQQAVAHPVRMLHAIRADLRPFMAFWAGLADEARAESQSDTAAALHAAL